MQTGYKHLNYREGDFPVSEDLSKRIFESSHAPIFRKKSGRGNSRKYYTNNLKR